MKTANPINRNVMLDPYDQCADALSAWGKRSYRAGLNAGQEWLKAREYDLYEYRNSELEDLLEMISCPALREDGVSVFTVLYGYAVAMFNLGFDAALERFLCQGVPGYIPPRGPVPGTDNTPASHDGSDSGKPPTQGSNPYATVEL